MKYVYLSRLSKHDPQNAQKANIILFFTKKNSKINVVEYIIE